jgi:hypothetical protein
MKILKAIPRSLRVLGGLLSILFTIVEPTAANAWPSGPSAACQAAYGFTPKYETIQMLGAYRESDLSRPVPYLVTPAERGRHRLRISDGRFLWNDGERLNHPEKADEAAIFVMDVNGDFYAQNPNDTSLVGAYVHHSTFLAGGEVAMAGVLRFEKGRLTKITTISGHYKVPDRMLVQVKRSLEEKGIDTSAVIFRSKMRPVDVSDVEIDLQTKQDIANRRVDNYLASIRFEKDDLNAIANYNRALKLSIESNGHELDKIIKDIWLRFPEKTIEASIIPELDERTQSIVRAARPEPRSLNTPPSKPNAVKSLFKSIFGRRAVRTSPVNWP